MWNAMGHRRQEVEGGLPGKICGPAPAVGALMRPADHARVPCPGTTSSCYPRLDPFQRSLGNSLPCKPSTATCQPPTANSLKPQEADRMGSLVLERAQALKVKPGRDFQLLKDGIAVISVR